MKKQPSSPLRHPIPWNEPSFYDPKALEEETRRIFDICHGCRRCFNLCDVFPRLFDLIDNGATGELDAVPSQDFKHVTQACTLCDICFVAKCPYVPPHEFNIDFPHLMLRHRAVEQKTAHTTKSGFTQKQLSHVDRNGKWVAPLAPLANKVLNKNNKKTRRALESLSNIHRKAILPSFHKTTLVKQAPKTTPYFDPQGPSHGKRVVLYGTCYGNFHNPRLGLVAQEILEHNGIETVILYPQCCGMPQLEQGLIPQVAQRAENIADFFLPWIHRGYTVVPLMPSCTLMIKQEWPLLLPNNTSVRSLAAHTTDLCAYIVGIDKEKGLKKNFYPLSGTVVLHMACHARAQNIGYKAQELLGLIPGLSLKVIDRCSGHGGTWGLLKENFPVAHKVGKVAVNFIHTHQPSYVVSECPLAVAQFQQTVQHPVEHFCHPLFLLEKAYSLHLPCTSAALSSPPSAPPLSSNL